MKAVAIAVLLLSAAPSAAQSLVPGPSQPGRYAIQPVDGGVARLDTVTGDVSFCHVAGGTLRCRPSEDAAREDDERAPRGDDGRMSRDDGRRAPETGDAPRRRDRDRSYFDDDDTGPDRGGAMGERSERGDRDTDAELDRTLDRVKRAFRAFRDIARDFDGKDRAPDPAPGPDRT